MKRREFLNGLAAAPALAAFRPAFGPEPVERSSGQASGGLRVRPPRPEARHRHLQHREGLGRPDPHQEPLRDGLRSGRVEDDAQARRRADAVGRGACGGAEAVRGFAREDRRTRHDLRVPCSRPGGRAQERRRDEAVGEAGAGPRIAQREGQAERAAEGRAGRKTLEQIGKALAECGAAARDHGVAIQLEVHGEATSRLPRIRKILDFGGNHPGVRVCWNSNQNDLLDDGFDANFKLVRDQIGQVHMRDLFPRGVSLAQAGDVAGRDEVQRLLLRGDSRVDRSDPGAQHYRGLFRAYQNL